MSKYLVTISDVENDTFAAFAYGDFKVMNFAAKAGLAEIDGKPGDFEARIVEVEEVGNDEPKRSVVSVRGDAETVAVVVKKKIARERKENAPADETSPETGADSAVETA